MLFKLSNLNSNLALTLGYLNPALNNSALVAANFSRKFLDDQHLLAALCNCSITLLLYILTSNGRANFPRDFKGIDCLQNPIFS